MVQQGLCICGLLTRALLSSGHAFITPLRSPRTGLPQLHEGLKGTVAASHGQHKNKTRSFSGRPEGLANSNIALYSPGFAEMRAWGAAFVDKTGAIADLLCAKPPVSRRAFFTRPRKFGKSLTLDIMCWMLAAGKLPEGVQPWRNYEPVDVETLFGGLEVYKRLEDGDPSLGGLLQQAHFVISLGLGGTASGVRLEAKIISKLGSIAGGEFDEEAEADVLAAPDPGDALSRLIDYVPANVPIAVLVDEYDAAIISDVEDQGWEAAKSGIEALQSLLMVSKDLYYGHRIKHFVVTGVARFARTFLASSANNFKDLTSDPLLSAALGFSEEEIRATFGPELERLGREGTADDALHELAHWYQGYCFDQMGAAPCFNPYPVLVALADGKLTTQQMDGTSGAQWLGLTSADITQGVVGENLEGGAVGVEQANVDLADFRTRRVNVRALLLQTGLLTLSRKGPSAEAGVLECVVPNEFARRSLMRMLREDWPGLPTAEVASQLVRAARERDRRRFEKIISRVLRNIPGVIRDKLASHAGGEAKAREVPYLVAVWLPLFLCLPRDVAHVEMEYTPHRGRAGVVLELLPALPGLQEEVWVIEVGVGGPAKETLEQLRRHMTEAKFNQRKVVGARCAIHEIEEKGGGQVDIEWVWEG